MSQFMMNSQISNIRAEYEVSELLSHFSTDYIMDIMRDVIEKRFETMAPTPNAPLALEQNFKTLLVNYPDDAANINEVRDQTYQEIIDYLLTTYSLKLNPYTSSDKYSMAYYLYDFFAANFAKNITRFFTNYIISEKNMLYDACSMELYKKNKDSSTIYNKKVYKDNKLAIINANLEIVLRTMTGFDIDLITIFEKCYLLDDLNTKLYLSNLVTAETDFYKEFYCSVFNTNIGSRIITDIRLKIQQYCVSLESKF